MNESGSSTPRWTSKYKRISITPKHVLHQIPERAPEVFATCEVMLVNEQDVVLEAGIKMWLQPEVDNYWVVVAIDVRVDSVESLEELANEGREGLREGDTNSAWKYLLVVDIALNPCHEMFNVLWSWHLGGSLVVLIVLPEVFEFVRGLHLWAGLRRAELRDRTIEKVDLVVEIDNVDS